jgi:hypothetical protein
MAVVYFKGVKNAKLMLNYQANYPGLPKKETH